MTRQPQLDAIEISDGLTVTDMKRIFGTEAPPIDSADRRLEAWARVGPATNLVSVDDVLYSWDTRPRRQKNHAPVGRVYAQPRGGIPRDAGAYKIDADGTVLQIPEALRGILPGTEGAEASTNTTPENERSEHDC